MGFQEALRVPDNLRELEGRLSPEVATNAGADRPPPRQALSVDPRVAEVGADLVGKCWPT